MFQKPRRLPRILWNIKHRHKIYIQKEHCPTFNEGTAVCANYAALVIALAYRVDLYSEILNSVYYAWNLVEVENQLYYVDAAWLDTDHYFPTKEQVKKIKKETALNMTGI